MKESDWTAKCCQALTGAGAIIIPHVMGMMASNVPDRTIVCRYGNFFVEFKGERTKWRDGQRILAERINSRWPCCFLYRCPNHLSIGEHWTKVDAIADPHGFLHRLIDLSGMVKRP